MPAENHNPSDQTLWIRTRDGDTSSFESLYRRHRDWALTLAARYTPDASEAADVVHEVFCTLLDKRETLNVEGSFRAYLAVSVRNAIAARRRKDRRLSITDQTPEPAPSIRATDAASDPRLSDLHAAIQNLSEDHREILLLATVQKLAHAEIATALGIPPGTVKSRLHNAIKRLREQRGGASEKSHPAE